ncbi:hypothetical protein HYZ82_02585 [Candidatus Nomurabacteria bacterium]|nr:hypothetical protein [Candidatus Nomurabacteria bacterium]
MNTKIAEWILRIAIAGTFIGHGVFAIQAKAGWFVYFKPFGITNPETITTLLLLVGIVDIILAALVLAKPIKIALLWMAIWGLFTAMLRWPIGSDPIWDFVERWANWGAPLALLFLLGWPKTLKEWFGKKPENY